MDGPAEPIDDSILELLAERARTHPLAETVRTEYTSGMLSLVVVALDDDRYPDWIQDARIEIRWYTNGDYNFHYIETHTSDEIWQCRWDKHVNPHTTRTHFHPPPKASAADASPDQPSDYHPNDLFTRTVANVRQRIAVVWDSHDQHS
jgi:hypothetical protein